MFCSYSNSFYYRGYPGYFLLQTFAVLLTLWWLTGKKVAVASICLYPCLLLVWVTLTCWWANHSWAVMEGLRRIAIWTLLVLGGSHLLCRCLSLRKNLWDLVLAVQLLLGTIYIFRVLEANFRLAERFGFPYGNPNLAAAILGAMCVFAANRALDNYRHCLWRRCLLNGGAALVLACMVLVSGSKGALLAMLITLVICWFLFCPTWRLWLLLASFSALITIFVYHSWFISLIWPSAQIRLFAWQGSWNMICYTALRFLAGWGPGNFLPNFPDFQDPHIYSTQYQAPVVHYPHNYFLELWCEYGIIGLLLFLVVIGKILQSLWRIAHITKNQEERANAYAALALTIMLLLHAQVSVSLSYPHIQLFLALVVIWIASSSHSDNHYPIGKSRILLAAMIPLLVALWKYWSWDSLLFQRQFKKASLMARSVAPYLANGSHSPELTKAVATMASIIPPICENYYTCRWRSQLGRLITDFYDCDPAWSQRLAQPFWLLKTRMPKFGFILLTSAILHAKQNNAQQAQRCFLQFAGHNPFYPPLWQYWAFACKYGDVHPRLMLNKALELQKTYGQDGALLLGEALARKILGQKQLSAALMQQLYRWSLPLKQDNRAISLKNIAKRYLQAINLEKNNANK